MPASFNTLPQSLLAAAAHQPAYPLATLLVCDLQARWNTGQRHTVEDYLRKIPALTQRPEALLDLVYSEWLLREQFGPPPAVQEYRGRFPALADKLGHLLQLHTALSQTDVATVPPQPDQALQADQPTVPPGAAPAEPATLSHAPLGSPGGRQALLSDCLQRWHDLRRQGQAPVPEELCRDCPEVLDELIRQIKDGAAVEALLGAVNGESTRADPLDPHAAHYTQTIAAGRSGIQVPGYEILGKLGEGGMGVVYKARQLALNRVVALKMILAGGHARAAELARFRTEAEAIARLHHPNIVAVYEIGHCDGKPYFSLEFCAGGSLDRQLDGTPLQPGKAAQLLETLARAMHAAHQKNVIHRDLKPANVLLTQDGVPKITDFGLARKTDEAGQTATGEIMGTPSYMAPEQAGGQSKEIGPACDTYALGAILYQFLTGRPPFKAASAMDTVLQVLSDEPVPPRQLQSKTPRDLETICLKCLAKEPARRYATAWDLAEDLKRYQAGEPVQARPVSRLERGWRWCARNPVVAGLLAVVLLVLLLGAGIGSGLAVWALAEKERADSKAELAQTEKERADSKAELAEQETDRANGAAKTAQAAEEQAKKDLSRAEMAIYVNKIMLAQSEWEHGSAALAWELR